MGPNKKFLQAENSPPPPPITFLMVDPLELVGHWLATLLAAEASDGLFSAFWFVGLITCNTINLVD